MKSRQKFAAVLAMTALTAFLVLCPRSAGADARKYFDPPANGDPDVGGGGRSYFVWNGYGEDYRLLSSTWLARFFMSLNQKPRLSGIVINRMEHK